jgi:lipopolysaccharide export system permease protein
MRVPMIFQQVVPFIALFAAMSTLFLLNRKYELVVARAAGVSAWQFLLPLALGALLVGLAMVFVVNPLSARGFAKAEEIEAEWRAQNTASVSTRAAPWLKQRTAEGESIIGGKRTLRNGTVLIDATVIRFDPAGNVVDRIDAKRAELRSGFWAFAGATITARSRAPEFRPTMAIRTNLKREFVEERLALPETIPFFDLPEKIKVAQSLGLRAGAFSMHFHALMALPGMLVAMTLVAATATLRFVRFGQSVTRILGGVLAGFLLYVVSVLVKVFGTTGYIHPALAAWLPVMLAFIIGVSFLLYKEDG